jgi:hypothetical protein
VTVAPERADREGDTQALPDEGREFVCDYLLPDVYNQWGEDDIADAVATDFKARIEIGIKRYGRPLQTHNGRNAIKDAYEEALDLANYLKQAHLEDRRNGKVSLAYMVVIGLVFDLKRMLGRD